MRMTKIIYGTAWKKERTTSLVVSAPKHYREDLVGKALQILNAKHAIRREDLFIQTKYTSINGQDTTKPLPYNPSESIKKQVEASFQNSLSNLHTTYLDSYILHSPLKTIEHTLEAWCVLMALQDEGKVCMIGVSNAYDMDILHALGRERKVQVIQNRWYEVNEWDQHHDIQYQSFWTISGSPSLLSHTSLIAIAKASNCTPTQADTGITLLSGTTNEVHMQQDLAAEHIQFPSMYDSYLDIIRQYVLS
ncbi:Aldo/keto reductase [Tricholoma matsutake]|nr:Aldo/keto reductase [Tricholoma matsutake 945]